MAQSLTAPKVLNLSPGFSVAGSRNVDERDMRVTFGFAAAEVLADNTGAYQLVSIPAQTVVLAIMARVITAFTASVTLNIGDANSSSGWLATAKLAPQTPDAVGIYKHPQIGSQETYAGGRKYLTADFILVTVGAATIAAGLLEIHIQYVDALSGAT